ncbi:MAG: penicillin-binding transpeptidase domain-containing protein [Terriglobia bacterium]
MNLVRKKIAILAVAVVWLLAGDLLGGTSDPVRKSTTSATTSSKPALRSTTNSTISSKKKRTVRRRARRRNPWRISSYGDPAAEDNPAGEDPLVREAALEAMGKWNGSVVVVDPNSGRILSIINQPLALSSAFTPCSTFKPVVALAALKEGLITPETKIRVGRRTRMDLTEALAHSNNPFFQTLGKQLGFERLFEIAHRFGFGEKAGLNIPGESAGRFPEAAPKDGGVGLMSSHGKAIEVTPLQMAAVISAIANGGTLYHLQYPRTPEEIEQFQPQVRGHLEDLTDYFPHVREGMAAAVLYGTARSAFDPEEQIYGKTGTCSEDGARLGWFASYSSEQQPKYVVVVLLRGGKMMFGPHAAEIAGRFYRTLRLREQPSTQASSPPALLNGLRP